MTYHERFMRLALEEAEKAAGLGEVPVGAVIVRDGNAVVRTHNRTIVDSDPTAHAEILAIRSAAQIFGRDRLAGCSMYVTLEPCPMCAGAIVLARPDQLLFGAFDEKAGAAGSLFAITTDHRLNHHVETHGGVLDADCSALLRRFFLERRATGAPEGDIR